MDDLNPLPIDLSGGCASAQEVSRATASRTFCSTEGHANQRARPKSGLWDQMVELGPRIVSRKPSNMHGVRSDHRPFFPPLPLLLPRRREDRGRDRSRSTRRVPDSALGAPVHEGQLAVVATLLALQHVSCIPSLTTPDRCQTYIIVKCFTHKLIFS